MKPVRDVRDERGGIVTGWLLKLIVSLAVVGVCAFEAGAVVVARVTIDSIAGEAAGEAITAFEGSGATAAERAAREYVEERDATFVSFDVADDGRAVFVTASKKAKTLFLHRLGPTKSWTDARSTRRRGVS